MAVACGTRKVSSQKERGDDVKRARHGDRDVRDRLARAERGVGVQGFRLGSVENASHDSCQDGEDENDATHLIALLIHDSFPYREESDCA
jgi:hypothetical protein